MGLVTGFVVYQLLWWVMFLAVLPLGVEVEEKPQIGFATSAPVNPNLKKKIILTTILSGIIWGVLFFVLY